MINHGQFHFLISDSTYDSACKIFRWYVIEWACGLVSSNLIVFEA